MVHATHEGGCRAMGLCTDLHVYDHADNTNCSILHLLQAFLCLPHVIKIPAIMELKELTPRADTQDQHSSSQRGAVPYQISHMNGKICMAIKQALGAEHKVQLAAEVPSRAQQQQTMKIEVKAWNLPAD